MKTLVDIINFNSDASCFESHKWLDALGTSHDSGMYRWLKNFVELNKRVVLGLTGATVADMSEMNPSTIELINQHPAIFEIILRPFAHDIALLRTPRGFELNFRIGEKIINSRFSNVCPFYLPPEFMLTGEQVSILARNNVRGVFINPSRFTDEIESSIPKCLYNVRGTLGTILECVSCGFDLTQAYLKAIQLFQPVVWNNSICSRKEELAIAWRDGESVFLIPDGIERERYLLENEDNGFVRKPFLEVVQDIIPNTTIQPYPVHSFSSWMKEFRMLGFISRVREQELNIADMSTTQKVLWLQTINSDILASVEKNPIEILLRQSADGLAEEFVIRRTDRYFEGEDFLALLELADCEVREEFIAKSPKTAHIQKLRMRLRQISCLLETN